MEEPGTMRAIKEMEVSHQRMKIMLNWDFLLNCLKVLHFQEQTNNSNQDNNNSTTPIILFPLQGILNQIYHKMVLTFIQ